MATARVNVTTGTPSTNFIAYADLVSQSPSGNYSTVYYYVQAINRGSSGTYDNSYGTQTVTIGGLGGGGHGGTLPSGVGTGVQRWYDGPYGSNMAHNSAGNRGADTVTQVISGWGISRSDSGSIPAYPRIPKPPSQPGTPVASHVLPTSVQLDWTVSTDNAGSAIDGYLVRRWLGSSMSGSYTDVSQTNTLTRIDTGLTPGTTYTYAVYAHNGSYGGYSVVSGPVTIKTIAPVWVKVSGTWKYAVPYFKTSGVWYMCQPFVKVSGVWKQTG